jgi:molybdopterin/thiamine biosynthesis adenylyltransferase
MLRKVSVPRRVRQRHVKNYVDNTGEREKKRFYSPLQVYTGGIVAHETIKCLTSTGIPIGVGDGRAGHDGRAAHDGHDAHDGNPNRVYTIDWRDDLKGCLFDDKFYEELRKNKVLVVGNGAVGCETVKNMLCWNMSNFVLCDVDSVDYTNLERQLFYRIEDVGLMKVDVLREFVRKIKGFRVRGYNKRIQSFKDDDWQGVTKVIMALDNVQSRVSLSKKCVMRNVMNIDMGTHGSLYSTHVTIPKLTDAWHDTNDSVDETIPVCSVKLFPWNVEHCVAWSKGVFETLVSGGVKEGCELFKKYFVDDVIKLQLQHPENSMDEDGEPFWNPQRIYPNVVSHDSVRGRKFVKDYCNLYDVQATDDEIRECFEEVFNNPVPKPMPVVDNEDKEEDNSKAKNVFNKDSPEQISFVASATNLRALTFGLTQDNTGVTEQEVGRIAGNIIPAMITTTAAVGGIGMHEYIKHVMYTRTFKDVSEGGRRGRNWFGNMNTGNFLGMAPGIAEVKHSLIKGHEQFNCWDKIVLKPASSDISLSKVIKTVEGMLVKGKVSTVEFNDMVLYADFFGGVEKGSVRDCIVKCIEDDSGFDEGDVSEGDVSEGGDDGKAGFDETAKYYDLKVTCEDDDGKSYECPVVRVYVRKN